MALKKLKDIYASTNANKFNSLLKQRVVVTEKISSPSFGVRRRQNRFDYFKSNSNTPMNLVDRTVSSLYEMAIKHVSGLQSYIKEEMPDNWKFCFEYLPESSISSIDYENTPTNGLILTHIQDVSEDGRIKKVLTDPSILRKWSSKLEVQGPSIIFDGVLTGEQSDRLRILLDGTKIKTSFTKAMFSVFDNNSYKSTLNNTLDTNIDGLILTFVDNKKISPYKLEDFEKVQEEYKKSNDVYQLTVSDLLEYISLYKLSDIVLEEESRDRRYLELISILFNGYISENATKFIGINFEQAEFSKSELFNLNTSFLRNETTLKHVENRVLSELFKIMINTFKKKKSKTSNILDEDSIQVLNNLIDRFDKMIFLENSDKGAVYDYNDFVIRNKFKKGVELNEALKVDTVLHGLQPVNMFVGRFQPFTLGHAKVLEAIHKQNGYPVIVFLVKAKNAKKDDAVKRPYDESTQIRMFNSVQRQYKFLKEIFVINTAAIDKMFNVMRPKYEPVLWGTGSDRMKVYGYQVDNNSYREQLGVRSDFSLFEIPRTGNNISATQVRNAMIDGDEKLFKKLTPNAIHRMYDDLKSKLESSLATVESVKESNEIFTFEQYVNEGTFSNDKVIAIYSTPNEPREGETEIEKRGSKYYGQNDKFDFEAKNKKELLKKLSDWGMELIAGSID